MQKKSKPVALVTEFSFEHFLIRPMRHVIAREFVVIPHRVTAFLVRMFLLLVVACRAHRSDSVFPDQICLKARTSIVNEKMDPLISRRS